MSGEASALRILNGGLRPIGEAERISGGRAAAAQRNEARIFALQVVRDPVYRKNLLLAAQQRTLAPAVETTLLAYAYGRPTERVELGRPGAFDELTDLSTSDLAARARLIVSAAAALSESETLEGEALEAAARTNEALAVSTKSAEARRRKREENADADDEASTDEA